MRWKELLNEIEERRSVEALHKRTNLHQLHIAMIIKRGKMLEWATNFIGTRNRGCGYDHRSIHAERAVIKKLGDSSKLSGAVLVVIRLSKGTKEPINSKPCHSCQCHLEKCIKMHGLRGVYYSI